MRCLLKTLRRATEQGLLVRLKRDLYVISAEIRAHKVDLLELAQRIYGPSQISLESALSFHGWIPEGVFTVTSVCSKPGREFSTPLGNFSFERVHPKALPLGTLRQTRGDASFIMAAPWRALADVIYLRGKRWATLAALLDDLRIEPESISSSDFSILVELCGKYPNPDVREVLQGLKKEIVHE